MADFWARRNSVPAPTSGQETASEFLALVELQKLANGLSLKQGQVDIDGAIEMLGALQYHFQQFVRIVQEKAIGRIPYEAPDERFEAVAYIGRIGQLFYFATSAFAKNGLGDHPEKQIPSVVRLVPFRHKYTAHRARDKPREGTEEVDDINAELALGALGGNLFVERTKGSFESQQSEDLLDWTKQMRRNYQSGYCLFELHAREGRIEFNLELGHSAVMSEASELVRKLIAHARAIATA